MSRYRVTERELLEQVRHEGRMKDIYTMAFDGDKAETIAKKLKLDVKTVKKVLGERFTKADFDDNEDNNEHSLNAFELAKLFGTPQEKAQMKAIMHRNQRQGYTSSSDNRIVTSIQAKYYSRLREETELKEFNPDFGKDTRAGRTKETHADDKKTKDEDRIKSLENEIQRLKLELENEKNATVKPEPNPDTGEVPLTVGIAHKYLKDKQDKKEVKKEEVELTEYFATVHLPRVISRSDKTELTDFIKKNKKDIDYVDDDAGGNIEFEGKGAHELADKVKAKFGVRVTKESFEPLEDKSLSLDENAHTIPSMRVPMTVKYTYTRNPDLFDKALAGTKTGKKMKNVGPKLKGVYVLKAPGQDHIDFLQTLNSKGIMPTNKILGEELEEDTNKYITEKIKGIENKAKKSGMPYSILKKVYDRGMAAWKGGHRPGATQQQWAFARVNSFVTKSSGTWGKADKDLADKVRASKKEDVDLEEVTFSPSMLSQLKKAYSNLKTITPSNATKLNKILDTVTKDGLIDLYKAKIPFVSIGAGSKLSQKHNLSPKDINRIISKEEVQEDNTTEAVLAGKDYEYDGKGPVKISKKNYAKVINTKGFVKGKPYMMVQNPKTMAAELVPVKFTEEVEEDTNKYITEKIKGIENKAKKSGMPYSILKKVYDRGMAAWKGGHRPGATQQQWAFARVNSFVTKSSGTWGKADKDLADKVRASKKEEVELDELQNYSRQLKDPSKEMMVVDKKGKVSVIDKKEFEKYKRQGYMPAESVEEDGPCWKTHKQVGMKKKNGRMVPNCVPKEEVEEGFSSDAQRRAAFASGYKAKGKDKKEELDKDDKPLVKKVADMLKKASKKHASQSKMLDKAVNEADLTDKQVKMVRKVADKLPKDDFKKRYGKDADNVKFGTATNIVKKKLKIDEYEGARTLVDRLLKQERGDE